VSFYDKINYSLVKKRSKRPIKATVIKRQAQDVDRIQVLEERIKLLESQLNIVLATPPKPRPMLHSTDIPNHHENAENVLPNRSAKPPIMNELFAEMKQFKFKTRKPRPRQPIDGNEHFFKRKLADKFKNSDPKNS